MRPVFHLAHHSIWSARDAVNRIEKHFKWSINKIVKFAKFWLKSTWAGGINANKIFRINWNQSGCWVTKFNQKEIIRMLWKRSETFIHIPQHFWHKIAAYQKYLIEVWRGEFFLQLSSSSFIQCGEHTSIKCDLLSGQKTYSQPNKLHVRPKKRKRKMCSCFTACFFD